MDDLIANAWEWFWIFLPYVGLMCASIMMANFKSRNPYIWTGTTLLFTYFGLGLIPLIVLAFLSKPSFEREEEADVIRKRVMGGTDNNVKEGDPK